MSAPGLLERLANGIVRCDGSMGYVLVRHGVSRNTSFEFLNIEKPELIGEVHKTYLEAADVDLLQTNTFGANRFHLRSFGRGHEKFVDVINREGVEIARAAAAGTSALIGGSIGPLTHSSGDALRSKAGEGDRDRSRRPRMRERAASRPAVRAVQAFACRSLLLSRTSARTSASTAMRGSPCTRSASPQIAPSLTRRVPRWRCWSGSVRRRWKRSVAPP